MRIALLNLDCLATNSAIRAFISAQRENIAVVALSPPFRRARGGFLVQSGYHLANSGADFSNFLACNFLLPRIAGKFPSSERQRTIDGLCESLKIPLLPLPDVNAPEVRETFSRLGVDMIVSCYFDQILQPAILTLPRLGSYNIHTSMLPLHRGPMPVINGWADDPPSLGVTVHRIDQQIDTGATIVQESYAPKAGETVLQAMQALHARGLELLTGLLPQIERGECPSRPQEAGSYESFPTRAIIRKLRKRGVRLIDKTDLKAALRTSVGT